MKHRANYLIRWIVVTALVSLSGSVVAQERKIKIACIGNSVTYGLGLANREKNAYPQVLQSRLGEKYWVRNFGHSGATLLRKGHNPYSRTTAFHEALAFCPDIAVIELGLNDTDPRNWPDYKEEFKADYSWLIDTIRRVNPGARIYITQLTPIFPWHPRFLSGTRDWFWQIQSLIPEIARANATELLDLHTPLYRRPDLLADAVHPNEEGASILADAVYQKVTGNFGGFKLAAVFTPHMVIQRGIPVRFYGTGNSGETITIRFNGREKQAIANSDGNWIAYFPAMQAGGPYSATFKIRERTTSLDDILIGDVWLCSGQSNMAFPLKAAEYDAIDLKKAENSQQIRLMQSNVLAETGNSAWDTTVLRKVNQLEYFSGSWQVCDSLSAKEFSAVGYYFGRALFDRLGVPIGLIQVAVGGSTTESWIDRYTLEHHPVLVNELSNWRRSDFFQPWVRERADLNLKNSNNSKQRHPYDPSYNYEAGIADLTRFPVKGVTWYQGESNAHNVELHEQLFPALVGSWRRKWGYTLPFYYVQLSSIDRPSWPAFRFSQLNLLRRVGNSGMAVTSDLGDPSNVHPRRKKGVGDRLARLALRFTYGRRDITAYGPMPLTARMIDGKIQVRFCFAAHLHTADKLPLRGFSLIDAKGITREAAAVVGKRRVVITVPPGFTPRQVSYGWQPFTTANLVNQAGLPASTFTLKIQ